MTAQTLAADVRMTAGNNTSGSNSIPSSDLQFKTLGSNPSSATRWRSNP